MGQALTEAEADCTVHPVCAPTHPPLLQIILAIVFATQLADVKGASVSQVCVWLAQEAGGEAEPRGPRAGSPGGALLSPPSPRPPAPAVHGCRSAVGATWVAGGSPRRPVLRCAHKGPASCLTTQLLHSPLTTNALHPPDLRLRVVQPTAKAILALIIIYELVFMGGQVGGLRPRAVLTSYAASTS